MQGYRADIDGLRTIAVAPVVLYHAGTPGFTGGFVGVDVFFVISGFLITSILQSDIQAGRYSLIDFYERRARRILPALMTVIAATTIVGAIIMLPDAFADYGLSAIAATLFASNFWFWQAANNYFAPASDFMPLLHTWSLAVEEQFYIVFPPLLWLLARWGRRPMILTLLAITILSFVVAEAMVRATPAAAFYLAPARVWELGVGALLALTIARGDPPKWLCEGAAAIGLLAILYAVFLYDGRTAFPGAAALAPCLGAAAIIWAGGHGMTLTGRLLALRPMVFIGLISYSLYLWHWPIFAFLRLRIGEVEMPGAMQVAAIAASVLMGWLSWRFVEAPFRRRPPAGPFGRRAIFAASGAAMGAAVLVAGAVWATGGAPQRLSATVLAADAASRDVNPLRAECMNRDLDLGLCAFGEDLGPPKVLLWGDSHADALMPGVAKAAAEAGLGGLFAAKSGCPPLLGVDRADERPRHDCAGFNDRVLALLNEAESVELVILKARWALAMEGERPPGEAGKIALLAPPGEGAEGPEGNEALFRAGLARTIAAIRATGREVVLIGTVPEIGWHVPERTVAALRFGDALPEAPSRAAALARDRRAREALEGAAADPGVRYLPMTEVLCDEACATSGAEGPLYFDDDHLTRAAAEALAPPLLRDVFAPYSKR